MPIQIDRENLKSVILTLKGVKPDNFNSMERLVSVVEYLDALLSQPEEEKTKEVVEDGR